MNTNKNINKNIISDSVVNDIKQRFTAKGSLKESWLYDCHPDIESLHIKWKEKEESLEKDLYPSAIKLLEKGLFEFLVEVMPKRIPPHVLLYIFKIEFRRREVSSKIVDNLLFKLLEQCYAFDSIYDIWQISDKVAKEWVRIINSLDECLKTEKILCELSRNYKNLYKDFYGGKKTFAISSNARL